jgi:hypothetical protein
VAHAYNPSYSGGRDQERSQFEVSPGKQFMRPCFEKNLSQKKAGGVTPGVTPVLPKKKKK